VIHEYVARRLPTKPRIVILETPAGFEPNSDRVAGKIKEYLSRRLQNYTPDIHVVPARRKGTPFSPQEPEIVAPILEADEILLGPGSPTYAVRQLRDTLAFHMIAAKFLLGSTLFLSSAATIAFGAYTLPVYEIFKVGEDLHWVRGLDFFRSYGLHLTIIPHWNNQDGGAELDTSRCYIGRARFESLLTRLPSDQTVLGINEHTGLILDFEQGCCHVRGMDSVTILRGGARQVYHTGSSFPLEQLGNWNLPRDGADIPRPVWKSARHADKRRQQTASIPEPPSEVQALVEAREVARSRKDWTSADALREQVATLGWHIHDTPQGSELQPHQS
jgi:hypothetical protein